MSYILVEFCYSPRSNVSRDSECFQRVNISQCGWQLQRDRASHPTVLWFCENKVIPSRWHLCATSYDNNLCNCIVVCLSSTTRISIQVGFAAGSEGDKFIEPTAGDIGLQTKAVHRAKVRICSVFFCSRKNEMRVLLLIACNRIKAYRTVAAVQNWNHGQRVTLRSWLSHPWMCLCFVAAASTCGQFIFILHGSVSNLI